MVNSNLIDNINEGIFITDIEGKIIFANKALAHIHGYDNPEKLLNKYFIEFVEPSEKDKIAEAFRILIQTGETEHNIEVPIFKADGTRAFVQVKPSFYYEDDKIGGTQGIIIDITERKQAEESLKLFRNLIDQTNDAIEVLDSETGRFLDINETACRNLGYSREELLSLSVFDIDPSVDKSSFAKSVEELRKTGALLWEGFHRRKDSSTFPVEINIKFVQFDRDYIVTVVRDITERKRAEDIIKYAEERVRTFIENVDDMVYFQGLDGKHSMLNKASIQISGYSTEEFEADPRLWEKIIHPDDVKIAREFFAQYPNGSPFFEIEYRLRHKDGKWRWMHSRMAGARDSSGQYIGYNCIDRDITERKRMEEALRQSEKKYRSIFENAVEGIFQTTLDGRYISANPALARIFGDESSEALMERVTNFEHQFYVNPKRRLQFMSLIEEHELVSNFESQVYAKDRSVIWISENARGVRDVNGRLIGFEGTTVDITERKRAEDEVSKLNKAIENSHEVVFMADREGIFTFINPEFTKMYGYKADEVIGKVTPRILKSGFISDEEYKQFWNTLINKQGVYTEYVNKNKQGELINVEGSADPILDEKGDIIGFLGIQRDIAGRIKAKEELIKAKEKAELSNKLKDAFIANISHEIRTPLNGILGMTGLIQNSLSKYIHNEENNYFTAIDRASERIVRTIDMILNFSRLQVGDFPIKPKQFSLSLIIENLMKEYKPAAEGKSLKLYFENKSGEAALNADEYCIAQAVSNLMDNAIKYTVKGSVELELYTDSENKLKLDVRDSGIGISEDYIHQIFEPYTQEEIGYNRGHEGVGLGMSLVKKYLDLNGADITVVSKKEKGTTFTVHFNKSKIKKEGEEFAEVKSQEPLKLIPEDKPKSWKKPFILIVEDDRINQYYIRLLLKIDYETASAFSADSALEIIKSQTLDLILMDISLKGSMNGLELTKLLRQSKVYKTIPVIAVTGHTSLEDKQNCFNAGCNEYLPKPFTGKELIDKIEMFVGKGGK